MRGSVSRRVQLFATCLAEQFSSEVLEAMVKVLERLGIDVEFPEGQTCCGQPLYNSGFVDEARRVARTFLEAFGPGDVDVVAPSGSCVDMVRHHYAQLFPDGSPEHHLAASVSGRTYEFSEYLVRVLGVTDVGARFAHRVSYHASCHQLRGLGIRSEPKQLLGAVRDLELVELPEEETCCGFGGVFSVVFPQVSRAMVENKVQRIVESGADTVVACDTGCLINIGGALRRAGCSIRPLHLALVLASSGDAP